MDSTAFSMHYRSVARSDCSEDFKTLISSEEKTPTPGPRSTMQFTLENKPHVSVPKSTTTSHSNDMTLVGEYHDKYDYGRLSPPLIALDHNDMLSVSHITVQKSQKEARQDGNIKGIVSDDEHKKQVDTGVADDRLKLLSNKQQTAFGVLSKSLSPNQSFRDTLTVKPNEPVKDAFGVNSRFKFSTTSQQTPSNHASAAHQFNDVAGKEMESPLAGSITRLTDKPSHTLLNSVGLFKSPRTVTPFNNPTSLVQRASRSSLQKSISKLRILEASPISATLNAKLQDSESRSFAGLSKMILDGNKTGTPKNLVATQMVLPYENTRSGERAHQTILRSPDIRYGYKDDENKIGSTPVYIAGSNIGEKVHESEDLFCNVHNNSDTKGNSTNLSNNIEHEKFQPVMKDSFVLHGRMDEISCQKVKIISDQFGRNPSNKENNDTFNAENVPSQVNSAERKRKAENVTTDKVVKVKTSISSGLELSGDNGMLSVGPNLEHLSKIHTGFLEETKLLPDSVDKMNLHAIDRLEDILGQLQRSQTYQLISDEFRSQDKRAVETKLTLCTNVYEQAKLQLMHAKRERLLKNGQLLASGIRECETMKLNSLQKSLNVQVNTKDIEECQVDKDKIASMTQTVEDIYTRISNLTKSFHVSCKMKGEPNTADTIANANSYLMKRARCQIIRKDMQLFVIDDLKKCKDHHDLVLNYLDLISQRLTVTAGVVPRLSVSNTLNQMNIHKFKDMDASTAFGFVFNTGLVQKDLTATTMAHETQMTTSLLGNLVDVMDEIQRAKFEIKNLIHASFRTSFDACLDLELYFFDSNSRKKVTLNLDTSCLKRGIYPADVAACQIDVSVDESQISSNETLIAEIAAAVKDLRMGFFSILRLCRSISQLLGLQEIV
ncbi:uncharacterized protein LOC143574934 [Bidens hawaiensis]|uniref:uncharacterized protein LOC143574934 n=1 Tax=Bidens hawaiensis TaxID=980011 RepID=UPI0040496B14